MNNLRACKDVADCLFQHWNKQPESLQSYCGCFISTSKRVIRDSLADPEDDEPGVQRRSRASRGFGRRGGARRFARRLRMSAVRGNWSAGLLDYIIP